MMTVKNLNPAGVFMGRLGRGDDLLGELETFCRDRDIRAGQIWAIGAVEKARIGYYDQSDQKYLYRQFDRHLEIIALVGNISVLDQRPFVHAHITLADDRGRAFGGHLAPGTSVFACEFMIQSFAGSPLQRTPDPETGLNLWG